MGTALRIKAATLVAAVIAGAAAPPPGTPRTPTTAPAKRKGPLAHLPAQPGPHIGKIKALADNAWLNLGSPLPDPKWGKARGRAWGSRMPYAPEMRAAFLFGEGVHGWYNKKTGRYMDGLWAYDANGHRWVCVYPGSDVKNISLKMSPDGFEVDTDGQPIPVAQMGHGYEQVTYDSDRGRFMFMPAGCSNWMATPLLARRKTWGGGYPWPYSPGRCSPWMYNVATNRFELLKVKGACPTSGQGDVLVYVPSMAKAFFWRGGRKDAWLYDPRANAWSHLKPKGPPPPFGIDAVACLDPERKRIYVAGGYYPVSPGPHAFWCYDLEGRRWVDLKPKGKPCGGSNRYGPNQAIMNYDSVNDVVVLVYHRPDPGPRGRGVYIYDPKTNSWSDVPAALPKEIGLCPSGFYSAELNTHFIHVAGDSQDNGIMWAYRHKRVKE